MISAKEKKIRQYVFNKERRSEMPLVVVYNLNPFDFQDISIERIERAIEQAVAGIPELELSPRNVIFTFPQDPSITSMKVPVVIIVELLFNKRGRTPEVRQRLAQQIAEYFRQIPGNEERRVVAAVKRFDPRRDGFCVIGRMA